jgi:hypothetical protein
MKTIEQFMQEFLDEQARLNEKYFDLFLQPEKKSTERLEGAQTFGRSGTATTRMDLGKFYSRVRYHVRAEGESWIIEKTEFQCRQCHGTGRKEGTGDTCAKCRGGGWLG